MLAAVIAAIVAAVVAADASASTLDNARFVPVSRLLGTAEAAQGAAWRAAAGTVEAAEPVVPLEEMLATAVVRGFAPRRDQRRPSRTMRGRG